MSLGILSAVMPEAASTEAARTDVIFLGLLVMALAVGALTLGLVITFAVRYRRGSRADRSEMPGLVSREFEIGWTAATLFAFLFVFWWAASAEIGTFATPKDALEVHVVAKQWMWKTQVSNGAREINELHVPVGVPVRLVLTSQDVIHSFFVPAFRMKRDVLPGRETEAWFQATKVGTFHLLCSEFCGTDHSRMLGRIVVMERDDYADWLAAQPEGDDLAHEGQALFTARGCSGCHAPGSSVRAPGLAGLYGRVVPLEGGRTTLADESYLRDSILMPRRDVVAGYGPVMPSYAGLLSEGEVQALVAYIRALGSGAGRTQAAATGVSGSRVPGPPEGRSPDMQAGAPAGGGRP